MNKTKLLYIAGGVACLLFAAVLLNNADNILGGFGKNDEVVEGTLDAVEKTGQNAAPESDKPQAAENLQNDNEGEAVVYVTGSVKRPGVYTVAAGTRIYKVVALAGGFTEDADRSAVNLAAKVKDGAQIDFPSCVETAQKGYKTAKSSSRSGRAKNTGYSESDNRSGKRRRKSADTSSVGVVDINSASEEELDSLPGVGARTAALIVQYRQSHGRFKRKEDLLEIRGIGVKKYEKLKDYVTVGE